MRLTVQFTAKSSAWVEYNSGMKSQKNSVFGCGKLPVVCYARFMIFVMVFLYMSY